MRTQFLPPVSLRLCNPAAAYELVWPRTELPGEVIAPAVIELSAFNYVQSPITIRYFSGKSPVGQKFKAATNMLMRYQGTDTFLIAASRTSHFSQKHNHNHNHNHTHTLLLQSASPAACQHSTLIQRSNSNLRDKSLWLSCFSTVRFCKTRVLFSPQL
ncbi:hypothetical protein ACMFMF_010385 [Clarireedia jacksonii]